ncbi:PQQ-binding-like beta-propeller repeat protein [Bacteroidota bacterium]
MKNRKLKIEGLLCILILLTLFSTILFSQNTNKSWPGWRGFSKEGVSNANHIPTSWSRNENVLWKTEIPGLGHSSPVVEGDNIIVTTAYFTHKYKGLLKITRIALSGLSILLIFLLLISLYKTLIASPKLSIIQLMQWLGFSFVLGLITFFALAGSVFKIPEKPDHITTTLKWFYSGITVLTSLMLVSYTLKKKLYVFLAIIFSIILFILVLLVFRPYQEYYPLFGENFMVETILKTSSIGIFVLAGIILLLILLRKRIKINPAKAFINGTSKGIIFLICVFVVGAFITGIFGISIYRGVLYSAPAGIFEFPAPNLYYRDGYILYRLITLGIVIWFISGVFLKHKVINYWSKHISFGILIFAGLVFLEKNYLSEQRTYVRAVICIDRLSGEIRWKKEMFKGDQPPIHLDNSPATPTPILYHDTIYAYFGSPGLACLDTKGNMIWDNTDIPFNGIHGVGASPVYRNGLLIIVNDMADSSYITAIDGKKGHRVWTKQRESQLGTRCGYRTPMVKSFDDKEYIVTWAKDKMIVYELESGKEIGSVNLKNSRRELIASQISKGDTIFAADFNYLYSLDYPELLSGKNPIIWKKKIKQKGPEDSSPVYYKNMLFMVSDNGIASCYDSENGNLLWMEKLHGIYMSSCTVINGNVYFSNTSGLTTVVAAEREFRKISENNLHEPIYASFAPFDNQLFIRTTKHLWCISKQL